MQENDYQKIKNKEKKINEVRYVSVVEEYKRNVRIVRKIRTRMRSKEKLFEYLEETFRKLYNLPNFDFNEREKTFMLKKYKYIVDEYEKGSVFSVKTTQKNHIYKMIFQIKRSIFGHVLIKYIDSTKGEITAFGMRTTIQKYFYTREVKKIAKSFKNEIHKMIKSKVITK